MKQAKLFSYLIFALFLTAPLTASSQQKQLKSKPGEVEPVNIKVYKKPHCHCCTKWINYLKENDFSVTVKKPDSIAAVKDRFEIPSKLRSCHTALVDGYVVEGHVPVEAIHKLLKTQPDAKGIAVPNMPTGSPGMGNDGTPYKVYLFDVQGKKSVYAEY